MARLGRYFVAGQSLHLIQRGNDRQDIFRRPEDYQRYGAWLGEAASQYGCAIHAYVLMTNHVHLLVTPESAETTTIGFRCRRSATMSMAFATRSASPTEVPPNLMTIMATRPVGGDQ